MKQEMKIRQAVLAVMEVERRVKVTRDKKRQSLVELRECDVRQIGIKIRETLRIITHYL